MRFIRAFCDNGYPRTIVPRDDGPTEFQAHACPSIENSGNLDNTLEGMEKP